MLLLLTIQPSVEKLLWESCRTFSKCRVMPPWNSASESAPVSITPVQQGRFMIQSILGYSSQMKLQLKTEIRRGL